MLHGLAWAHAAPRGSAPPGGRGVCVGCWVVVGLGVGWEETNHQGKPELRGQASGLRVAVQHPCYTQQPRGLL